MPAGDAELSQRGPLAVRPVRLSLSHIEAPRLWQYRPSTPPSTVPSKLADHVNVNDVEFYKSPI